MLRGPAGGLVAEKGGGSVDGDVSKGGKGFQAPTKARPTVERAVVGERGEDALHTAPAEVELGVLVGLGVGDRPAGRVAVPREDVLRRLVDLVPEAVLVGLEDVLAEARALVEDIVVVRGAEVRPAEVDDLHGEGDGDLELEDAGLVLGLVDEPLLALVGGRRDVERDSERAARLTHQLTGGSGASNDAFDGYDDDDTIDSDDIVFLGERSAAQHGVRDDDDDDDDFGIGQLYETPSLKPKKDTPRPRPRAHPGSEKAARTATRAGRPRAARDLVLNRLEDVTEETRPPV